MDLTAQLWSMNKGIVTELRYKDQVFVIKTIDNNPTNLHVEPEPKKTYTHGIKISYLEKWIKKGSFEVFTLDMFFKQFPKQKYNNRLEFHIRSLIDKKIISQFNKPSGMVRFKVNRGTKR